MKLRDLLADPPWTKKRMLPDTFEGADAIETDLSKLAVPIAWRTFERERFLGRTRDIPRKAQKQTFADVRAIEERAAAFTDTTDPRERISLHVVLALDDVECARVFNLAPLRAFESEAASLQAIVARLEAKGAWGLVRRSQDMALRLTVFRLLGAIGTPLAVPVLLDALLRLQSLRGSAKRTLLKFSDVMLDAIVPLAIGTPAKNLGLVPIQKPAELVRSARLALHWLSGSGEDAKIARTAKTYGQDEAIRAVLAEDPLTGLAFEEPNEKLLESHRPSWGNRDSTMDDDEWTSYLVWLSLQDWETPRLLSVRDELDKRSLELSMQSLFDAFIALGAPKACSWIPHAAFELGGREVPKRARAVMREWKAAYQTPAVATMQAGATVAVRHFGDPIADGILEMLGELAIKSRSKAQEQHAQNVIQWIDDELEDVDGLAERLVPSLGLDERGRVAIDFGERKFVARLGTALELHVLDEDGARLPKLPGARKSDDAAKAKSAKAAMTALGRDARRLVARVTTRMQDALRSQKRWPAPVFELLVVRHPVVGSVARGLVWMAFDEKGPVATFNVVEDRTFADVNEKRFELAIGHEVAVAHPALVDAETWAAWTRILGDYEIIQPIPQLSWPVVRLDAAELAATESKRIAESSYTSARLVELGWQRGPWRPDIQNTCTYELVLGGVRAMLFHEPAKTPYPQSIVAQSLRLQRLEQTDWDRYLPFSTLDPVRISELFRDLSRT